MAFKSEILERGDIISIVGAAQNDYEGQKGIMPITKGGYSNTVANSSSGDYDGGDRVIGWPNSLEVDGDLLFTAGWGDGFAIRRLNNDGSLTKLYHDNNFLYRDSSSTYNHMQSVAISTTQKKGVVMTYNVDGYTTFDYSGLVNGGTTFSKDARPTHSNPQRFIGGAGDSGLNISSAGLYYTSGLVAAGDWIYVGEYDARHYRRCLRRSMSDGTEEVLGSSDGTADKLSGSATVDRNGYRFTLFYDEVNDRVFYFSYYNGNFQVVLDASTSTPELLWCDIGDTGKGDDGYEQGLFIPDPTNAPNRMWIGGSNRILDIDITPCLTGGAPTVHNDISVGSTTTNIALDCLFRFGNKYQKTSGLPMDKDPTYTNYIRTYADRGRNRTLGWVDITNNKTPCFVRHNNQTEDTTTGSRGRSIRFDYGGHHVLMASANGTKYWVQTGYSYDGHRFMTYEENDYPKRLVGNWEIVYGTYTLANSANIDEAFVSNVDKFDTPSNCSLTVYLSNNNGSSWETYDLSSTIAHKFSSTGTQLRVKISASGHPDKSPYYMGYDGPLTVHYKSLHEAAKNSNIKYKITRKRLR
jgi:hypothetical protein